MGVSTFKTLLKERKDMFAYLKEQVGEVATKYGERVLKTPNNPISIGESFVHYVSLWFEVCLTLVLFEKYCAFNETLYAQKF